MMETLISMTNMENNMKLLCKNLMTDLLPSRPSMLMHNSSSPKFISYNAFLNEE